MEHNAVATLLLVENSQAVLPMWPDLQDRYLQLLVSKLGSRSPMAQTQNTAFLTLESMPVRYESQSAVPRQYDSIRRGLRELRFHPDPQNRLSVRTIWSGVDFLASTFQGQPAARHLIIVAASTPWEDDYDKYGGGSTWQRLAQKISQANIHCHIVVVSPKQDTTRLTALFEDTLRQRNCVEEPLSFPTDPWRILFRVSAEPGTYTSPVPQTTTSPHRGLPRRNNSFPSDPYVVNMRADEQFAPSNSGETASDNPPTLVLQLQQVHGLTKKKVYGTKPPRKSFIRDERVRKDSIGSGATSSPLLVGGRAPSKTRTERVLRVAQTGSPTESFGRRPGMTRRGSRLSSPETDVSNSPTSYHIPSSISPVSPTSPTNPYPPVAPMPSQQKEPSWLQVQYPPVVPSLSESFVTGYPTTQAAPSNTESNWHTTCEDPNYSILAATAPSTVTKSQLSLASVPSHSEPKSNSQVPGAGGGESITTSSRPSSRRVTCAEDEEPFTFDEGYVAATAALFKNEVLPAYPNLSPLLDETAHSSPYSQMTTPRQAFYIVQDHSVPPSPTSVYDYEPYFGVSYQHPFYPTISPVDSPGLRYAPSYSSGSTSSITSSLTGWAG